MNPKYISGMELNFDGVCLKFKYISPQIHHYFDFRFIQNNISTSLSYLAHELYEYILQSYYIPFDLDDGRLLANAIIIAVAKYEHPELDINTVPFFRDALAEELTEDLLNYVQEEMTIPDFDDHQVN